jgi:Spy/CpxP family protein refolding chaperone
MKKIFLGFIAIASISLSACAQVQREQPDKQNSTIDHEKFGRGHGGHMDGMMKDLNVSDAQKQQLSSINADFRSKLEELNKHDNMTVKDFNAQKEALENDRKAKFEAILTPDQKNQLAELKNNRGGRENMKGNRENMKGNSGKNGNNRMEKMQSELGLTSDQVARMQAERESFKTKADAIKNNTSLSEDQKKEKFIQLRKDREQSLKTYLNADQLKKFEEMKSKRGNDSKNKRTMKTS